MLFLAMLVLPNLTFHKIIYIIFKIDLFLIQLLDARKPIPLLCASLFRLQHYSTIFLMPFLYENCRATHYNLQKIIIV